MINLIRLLWNSGLKDTRQYRWQRFFSFFGFGDDEPEEEKKDRRSDGYQIIGVKELTARHKTGTYGSVFTQTTEFRTAGDWDDLKADAARLEFTNSTGGALIMKECLLVGKLVLRNSGMFVHDKFKDQADIERNGEKALEFYSDDIVTNAHTSNIATYLWQRNQSCKHYYDAQMKGSCHWLHPGIWARFTVGGVGQSEYIDSIVRVEACVTSRRPGSLGTTNILLGEVAENWKYNSSYRARTIANAVPFRNAQGASVIWVASSTGTEIAHIYCEGSADQVGIQAAINSLSNRGGGVVHLGPGTYITAAAIEMKSNVTLEGEGPNATIIEKNCNDYAIESVGVGAGSENTNITIKDLKITRSDSESISMMYITQTDESYLSNIVIEDSYDALTMSNCEQLIISKLTIKEFDRKGIVTSGTFRDSKLADIIIDGIQSRKAGLISAIQGNYIEVAFTNISIFGVYTSYAGSVIGIKLDTNNCIFENIILSDFDHDVGAQTIYGISIVGSGTAISNIRVDSIDNSTTAANSRGIYISGDNCVMSSVIVTSCTGTGVELNGTADKTMIVGGRSTGNGTNYTDGGTNTSISSFDVT